MAIPVHPIRALLTLFGFGQGSRPRVQAAGKNVFKSGGLQDFQASDVGAWFQNEIRLSANRIQRYTEFDMMADDDILLACLQLYVEDSTQASPSTGRIVWCTAREKDIQQTNNDTLDRCEMEEKAGVIAFNVGKCGDYFAALLQQVNEHDLPVGVAGIHGENPKNIERVQDALGRTVGYARGRLLSGQYADATTDDSLSAPWDYIHWRLGAMDPDDPAHGRSLYMPARRTYKFFKMMEEAVVMYRILRHPDRLKWKLGTGGMTPDEWQNYAKTMLQQIKKNMLYDSTTGETRGEMSPWTLSEDLIIPTGEGVDMDVDVLAGSAAQGNILDLDFMRKKLFGCMRIPPDYLGFADSSGTLSGKAPLANQDIRYARGVKALQKAVMIGCVTLLQVDMIMKGLDPNDRKNDFTVHMHPVTYLDEVQMAEAAKTKAETVDTMIGMGERMGIDKQRWLLHVAEEVGLPEELITSASKEEESTRRKNNLNGDILTVLRIENKSGAGEVRSSDHPLRLALLQSGGEGKDPIPVMVGNRTEVGTGKLSLTEAIAAWDESSGVLLPDAKERAKEREEKIKLEEAAFQARLGRVDG